MRPSREQWLRWKPWLWRLATAVAVLAAIGYLSDPVVSPLMCKVYG